MADTNPNERETLLSLIEDMADIVLDERNSCKYRDRERVRECQALLDRADAARRRGIHHHKERP